MKPLAIDLFCGLGGWASGLLDAGYYVVGFDIEQHVYGEHRYPAQLVIQDVLTLHGSQFKDAALIVCSPPCQFFSYTAMPWSRAKALAAQVRADSVQLEERLALFNACFRIQAEASLAAGRHIPMVVENVRGAQPWVGRSRWNFGSYHLWGDVPALMPSAGKATKVPGINWANYGMPGYKAQGFNVVADKRYRDGVKTPGFRFDGSGRSFQTASVEHTGVKVPMPPGGDSLKIGFWQTAKQQMLADAGMKNSGGSWFNIGSPGQKLTNQNPVHALTHEGIKVGGDWFSDPASPSRQSSLKSTARKAASAMIAKIPYALSSHIARCYLPSEGRQP
jgi:hypothetical protein